MTFVETMAVQANLCTCQKSRSFTVSGDSALFDIPEENCMVLPLRFGDGERPNTVLQSILVICGCGHITIHYPLVYPAAPGWRSRKTWRWWRNTHIRIDWPHGIEDERKTLKNVRALMLCDRDGSIRKGFYFINVPGDDMNIHPGQHSVASQIFTRYLVCWTFSIFCNNVDYLIRDNARTTTKICLGLENQRYDLEQTLPALLQEIHNIRHATQSSRLRTVRIALQNLCTRTEIAVPRLTTKDTGQPDIVKQLAAV